MSALPDEELPVRLAAAEQALAVSEHRWFTRAGLLAALATGLTLMLPWTYSRRLGLSVWQLGVETQPQLALTWLAGLATTTALLILKPGHKAQAAAGITAVITLLFLSGAYQAGQLEALGDTWLGPGPAVALATTTCWLMTTAAHLLAHRNNPHLTPEAITRTIARLRRREP
ncbi:hypothetical protein E1263_01740 [Kribbella antibiotica]|uniref:Uncharacterized protein n=1 Tax=Kribbella antibiotica TaxID=190195 RepID=A0A4R4ZVW1_9ACTN|nr:hypothetical protein [Kribbella antibiotica]TDD63055.1 hypothetical protein E1263_01740 [Kribbella antibiotica]